MHTSTLITPFVLLVLLSFVTLNCFPPILTETWQSDIVITRIGYIVKNNIFPVFRLKRIFLLGVCKPIVEIVLYLHLFIQI